MIKISNKWLSVRTKREFRKINNIKYKDRLKEFVYKSGEFLQSPKSIVLIAISVIIIYLTCLINISFPSIFIFNRGSAFEILNDRLTDFIAVFSISIVVSVFIISAIQAKKEEEEIFTVVFREAWIYPIFYFGLVNIGIAVFLTYTEKSEWLNTDTVINASVLFLWLFIFYLSLIAVIYYRVYQFISTDHLFNKYIKETEQEISRHLYNELIKRLSLKIYYDELTKEKLKDSFFSSLLYKSQKDNIVRFNNDSLLELLDINLNKLIRILKYIEKAENRGEFNRLYIKNIVSKKQEIFYIDNDKVRKKLIKVLNKIFITKNYEGKKDYLKEYKERIKNRLLSQIKNQNYIEIERINNFYIKIFEAFMKYAKKYKLEYTSNNYPELHLFENRYEVIARMELDLYIAFTKANDLKDFEIQMKLIESIYSIQLSALNNKSKFVFNQFKHVYVWILDYMYNKKALEKGIIERILLQCSEIIRFGLDTKIERREELSIEDLRTYYGIIFFTINDLFYVMIKYKDMQTFDYGIQLFERGRYGIPNMINKLKNEKIKIEFNSEKNDYEKDKINLENIKILIDELEKILLYDFYTKIGVQSWLWYKYKTSDLSKKEIIEFQKNLKIPHIKTNKFIEIMCDFNYRAMDMFNWNNWGDEKKRIPFKVYTPISTDVWLIQGFIYELIRKNLIHDGLEKNINNDESYRYIYDRVKPICEEIMNEFEKWSQILNIPDETDFQNRIKKITKFFKSFKERYEINLVKSRADQEPDKDLIKEFKKDIYKAWDGSNIIHKLFSRHNLIKYSNDKSIKGLGHSIFGIQYKMMFVKDNYSKIFGVDEYGSLISSMENDLLLSKAISAKTQIKEAETLKEVFEIYYAERKNKKIKTNLILLNSRYDIFKSDFMQTGKLIPHWHMEGEKEFFGFEGTYENIPIVDLYSDMYREYIIFCDFEKSFSMTSRKDKNWEGGILDITVRDLSDKEVEDKIKEVIKDDYKESWMKNSNNGPLKDEDLRNIIKSSVLINIFEYCDITIKDKDAFDVIKVKSKTS